MLNHWFSQFFMHWVIYPTIHPVCSQFGSRDANRSVKNLGTIQVSKALCSPIAHSTLSPSLHHADQAQCAHGKSMLGCSQWLSCPSCAWKWLPWGPVPQSSQGLSWGQPACCLPDVSLCLRAQLNTSGSDFFLLHDPSEWWYCFTWPAVTWDYNHVTILASNSKCWRAGNTSSWRTGSTACLAHHFLYFFRKLPSTTNSGLQTPLPHSKKKIKSVRYKHSMVFSLCLEMWVQFSPSFPSYFDFF